MAWAAGREGHPRDRSAHERLERARLEAALRACVDDVGRLVGGWRPPAEHWIGGGEDGSESWCRPCAEREIRSLRRRDRARFADAALDGGWEAFDRDHAPFCEGCGRLLDHVLTDFGIEQELRHHAEWAGLESGRPQPAYEMLRFLEGCEGLLQGDREGRAERVARAGLAVGLRYLAEVGHARRERDAWEDDGGSGRSAFRPRRRRPGRRQGEGPADAEAVNPAVI